MKLSVRSFLSLAKWGELDTDSGVITPLELAPTNPNERGYFMRLGEVNTCFCANDGKLMLFTEAAQVPLTDTTVEFAGGELRHLRIQKEGDLLLRLSYPNPVNPPMEFDFTMAEEEDFDLGLFLRNVLASEKRKSIMLKKWS